MAFTNQAKSQPISIKSASKASSNNDEDESFGDEDERGDGESSVKSCADSIDSTTFSKAFKLSGDEQMKF